jgi:hypothetical protein
MQREKRRDLIPQVQDLPALLFAGLAHSKDVVMEI